MLENVFHLILAAFGLGFLIFIHELGHYFMAKRVGMKVEAFSIGFGKPLFSWKKDGVVWKICVLPFGGYVKIAGMEKQGNLEPHQIPDGFFGKKPSARIKVAIMGPLVNIFFAFVLFVVIWSFGGRLKPFAEFTHIVGWVDPQSRLFQEDLRPGDQIISVDERPFESFKDLLYAQLLDGKLVQMTGMEVDYFSGSKTPFSLSLKEKNSPAGSPFMQPILPANYLIYHKLPEQKKQSSYSNDSVANSGIQEGDRFVAVDGELLFSMTELSEIINEPKCLLTIKRGDKTFLSRVPRISVKDLRMSSGERAELDDWRNLANISGKVEQLYFIPYNLTPQGTVESALSYLTDESLEKIHRSLERSKFDVVLQPKDQIIAVDGTPVTSSLDIVKNLQERKLQFVVKRNKSSPQPVSWQEADHNFIADMDMSALEKILVTIGTENPIYQVDDLYLLAPVIPQTVESLAADKKSFQALLDEEIQKAQSIKNPKEKALALQNIEQFQKKLYLGVSLQDEPVIYNPSPFRLLGDVFGETYRTLRALISGYLNPKWMSGPVGIVQVMQQGWSMGVKEALFWIAIISANLGILNLLPIPVLDGGHICFALYESITKKPIKAKTMERLVIPFVLLLIGFLIFVTYQDLARLFQRFF